MALAVALVLSLLTPSVLGLQWKELSYVPFLGQACHMLHSRFTQAQEDCMQWFSVVPVTQDYSLQYWIKTLKHVPVSI